MKLKTLGDLGDHRTDERYEDGEYCVLYEDLNEAAIKWAGEIKNFKQPIMDKIMDNVCGRITTYSEEARIGVINFIKHFFSITDEEIDDAYHANWG